MIVEMNFADVRSEAPLRRGGLVAAATDFVPHAQGCETSRPTQRVRPRQSKREKRHEQNHVRSSRPRAVKVRCCNPGLGNDVRRRPTGQSSGNTVTTGMMCGGTAQAADDPMADKPAQERSDNPACARAAATWR